MADDAKATDEAAAQKAAEQSAEVAQKAKEDEDIDREQRRRDAEEAARNAPRRATPSEVAEWLARATAFTRECVKFGSQVQIFGAGIDPAYNPALVAIAAENAQKCDGWQPAFLPLPGFPAIPNEDADSAKMRAERWKALNQDLATEVVAVFNKCPSMFGDCQILLNGYKIDTDHPAESLDALKAFTSKASEDQPACFSALREVTTPPGLQ